jgi:uroporphyrinogen III methyltransferase/synthase
MIAAARAGRVVVRLKGGDPDVFGRGADEIEALTAAGIPFEVVPGVTAALAAAGYAGIPITHGKHASAVALVTGHERTGHAPLDYAALAGFPGTLVFYMGIASAAEWSGTLIEHGKPADTPVAIVRRCTWPDQETIHCTLADVAEVIARRKLRPPAVIVVGDVVGLAPAVSWFAARPLFGVRVMVTRPLGEPRASAGGWPPSDAPNIPGLTPGARQEELRDELSSLGAEVFVQPAIRISDPPDWRPVDAAIARLDEFDWLVFSSSNGVRYFVERVLGDGSSRSRAPTVAFRSAKAAEATPLSRSERRQSDIRRFGHVKLAAIGPGTAEELALYHLRADVVPEQFRAESLAEALIAATRTGARRGQSPFAQREEADQREPQQTGTAPNVAQERGQAPFVSNTLRAAARQTGPVPPPRFLLLRASRGREVLAERLTAAGGIVEQVVVYSNTDVTTPEPEAAAALRAGRIDWITVTSSTIARSLVALFGADLRRSKLASISPITSGVLRELGFEPAVEAAEYTMAGLIAAMRRQHEARHVADT